MSIECPNGHGRQNIIVNLTADGSNPIYADQIVARKLACGCVVGGEEFEAFQKASIAIDIERANAIRQIEEEAQKKKAAAYQGYVVARRGEKHAE